MTVSQILNEVGMSSRAAFYSGRGATLSDLNAELLLNIQSLIKQHKGDEASEAFVEMVKSMEELNATDFINNCYLLESQDFKWATETAHKSGFDFDKDENGNHNRAQVMATLISSLHSKRDDTLRIKLPFLRANRVSIPAVYYKFSY